MWKGPGPLPRPSPLAASLEREHREVDAGIEEFLADADSTSVELGRGALHPAPLRTALRALRRHIYLEEEFLFPPIRAAGMVMPIMVMVREHGALWRAMDDLDELLAAPTEAAGELDRERRERILAGCRELLTLLDQHNRKEEPIIYPRAADLTDEATAELADFLRTGDTPDGWVCQQA